MIAVTYINFRFVLHQPHAASHHPGCFTQSNLRLFWFPATSKSQGNTRPWTDRIGPHLASFFVLFPHDGLGFTSPICSPSEYAYKALAALEWHWTFTNLKILPVLHGLSQRISSARWRENEGLYLLLFSFSRRLIFPIITWQKWRICLLFVVWENSTLDVSFLCLDKCINLLFYMRGE